MDYCQRGVKLKALIVKNFRRLGDLQLTLNGASAFLIAENAGGKTATLVALARALGVDVTFSLADFDKPDEPIEIIATLVDLDLEQQGVFAERIEFGQEITLQIGALATWDPANGRADVTHGYPRQGWSRSTRDEREALPFVWLPAWRDPARLLAFGASRGVLADLLEKLPLAPSLQQALQQIEQAAQTLSADPALQQLLTDGGTLLGQLIPTAQPNPFGIGVTAATERDLLRQFQLLLTTSTVPIPVPEQSSGMSQLAVFVFALRLLREFPGAILAVDEPEVSLHPQAQRALVALLEASAPQTLVATHSSNVLDGVDPRRVVRLRDVGGKVEAAVPSGLSDGEAIRLARLSTPLSAEAFFARKVIIVEGISDALALRAFSRRLGRSLDAEGVTLLSADGGGGLDAYLKLLGPAGLGLDVAGLCDADQEAQWGKWLEDAGLGQSLDRAGMEALGFFVCDQDLEDELIRAVGLTGVEHLVAAEGEDQALQTFAQQPQQAAKPRQDVIRAFFRKQGRKARYAPLLVDAVPAGQEPRPLTELLARV